MKKLISVLLLFFASYTYSQKEANFWYFGENAGIDFSTSPPTTLTNGQLDTTEGCSSFSSPSGDLLFYSDGIEVFNKNHELMNYADGRLANDLKGNPSSTQSGMIIPKPGSNTIYYLFTVGTDFVGGAGNPNPGFNYYTIDMSSNNGFGEITDGPVNLAINPNTGVDLSERWSEKVAAVKGKDCNTFWVVSFVQSTFYAYEVTTNGVEVNTVVTSTVDFSTNDKRGYLQVSPNGEKIAFADYSAVQNNIRGSLVLFDFNNDSGEVAQDSEVLIPYSAADSPYGVAFSRDSKKLYTSTYNGNFNVYQFSLDATNIPASKATIRTKTGFRGALQLGPNGKIYASIPQRNFLDAIENPSATASDVIYTDNAINLEGKFTAQGLPPFISSLLLPIEVVDSEDGSVINDEDLAFCIGQNKTIIPASISGTGATYAWSFDDGTSTGVIQNTKNLILNNLAISNSGKYTLVAELTDACGNVTKFEATFNITVFEAATANPIIYPPFCDTDNDGFNTFDLQTDISATVLGGLDATVFEVVYFDDSENANSGNNPVADMYSNPSAYSTQTIYARVQNKEAPNACFDITSFTLAVTGLPVPETPSEYPFCDNTTVGSDTDGFVNNFILEDKDAEILGSLDANQYVVSYHTSQNGAQTNASLDAIPKTTNYTNTTANAQLIFVRVENVDNAACFDASKSFNLIVNALPILKPNPELEYCLSATNTNPTINLTLAELNISDNYLEELFKYYEDALGIDEITNPTEYPVISNTRKSVYVKVFNAATLCSREIVELVLNIATEDDNDYDAIQTPVCDDFTGVQGSDSDQITDFYLDKTAIINSINPPANTNVFFYESINNRANSIEEINITNYRNNELAGRNDITTVANGIQFPIYYKILSEINNNCQGLGQFYVQINTVPIANQVANLEVCDSTNDGDGTNGIAQNFNLESQTPIILGTQNSTDYTVTYHLSKADANAGNDPQISLFENTLKDLQTIYVRVTNNSTACFTDHTSFDLIVNPLPIANFVEDIEICDDPSDGSARNGFSQSIDLESQTEGILGTQDPNVYAVTYHHSLEEAQNGDNTLRTPYTNSTPNRETIFVRVYDSATRCANGISNFDVLVNPEPVFTRVSNLSYCDNDLDGDAANGIVQNIDLESQIPLLLGASQDPDDYTVTFHHSQTEATSGNLPIASPYANSETTETIYVRVQNRATSCINDDATFDIIVNSLPEFNVTSSQILCLNDLPKNIFVENPEAIYNYEWQDASGNAIGDEDNLDITTGGSYTVTATTTNGTNCSRTATIKVTESNPAVLLNRYITIVDEGNNLGSERNLSIVIDVVTNDLGPGDYQFALKNDDENTTTLFQDEPLFENLEGGIYTLIVNDKNGCSPNATLQVSVLQFPEFFTPNGDGKNDTWKIKGANKTFYPNSSINIFNRYGKLVAQLPIDAKGWNGTYNGKKLSSDDYWYNTTLIPADTTKQAINKTGNFSLLRK